MEFTKEQKSFLYKDRFEERTVSIGGGGGSYVVLLGLTALNRPDLNTAIFGTWDNGGKSGYIRLKDGVVPPGDYFLCLLAMMESDLQRESVRNLLYDRNRTPMLRDEIASTAERVNHGIQEGINCLRHSYRISGRLFPISTVDLTLYAETKNGNLIDGETNIDKRGEAQGFDPEDITRNVFFNTKARITEGAHNAILEAQRVIFAPGSPYTSLLPHLLVDGMQNALWATEAKVILNLNLMNTRGEDHHLNVASKYVAAFQHLSRDCRYIQKTGKSRIDYLIANNQSVPLEVLQDYKHKCQDQVILDREECERLAPGIKIIEEELLDDEELENRYIRHDPYKLARTCLSLG